ncbi:putative WD40-repeat-containing domain-containing protein [Heracleum sosnowskyi]|uniref:WD40-repeat-containing domain-containing protein n=1 Tax=Heracleum sosnowskyi TaxID=360622 RepID=A0AAD8J476_9APIA|nr:putative WD40-repeat-containing domain-containing protein [Heracleum sosnowskyi]
MAVSLKGKSFHLYFILIFHFLIVSIVFANTSLDPDNLDDHNNNNNDDQLVSETPIKKISDLDVLNQQQVHIEKLEEVVDNLAHLVLKLESLFQESIKIETFDDKEENPVRKLVEMKSEESGSESSVSDGEIVGAVSITKHSLFWSERFQFVSAVKLDSGVTCVSVLPFKDSEGMSKYVAVGNDQGKVYVFSRNGDVLIEFSTLSQSPVTTMLLYMSLYNQSVLVTGHENGIILMHRVSEMLSGEEGHSLLMETDLKFVPSEIEEGGSRITMLEIHNVGRTRYILSIDASGKIKVFRENGALHGLAVPMSRPLVFIKQKLLFLTETGAGSLDLRTMKILESSCEGLNQSVQNYVFDATERSKAYGFTSEGDLIHVLLLGDIMNFKCRVRSMKKFDMDEPLAIQAIKGYLLVSNRDKVFVYNVSSSQNFRSGGPRLLFSAGLEEIVASFLKCQVESDDEKKVVIPLMASDQEKLVILSLGSGYVGVYRSSLPVYRVKYSTMIWGTPLVIFILFVFGAWKFFANKKDAYSLWGPEDPFTSISGTNENEAPVVSGSGDRSFTDSSSKSEIMDLRGSGLRGPSRRYGSPSRYTGGVASSFRPNPSDTNSRPASVDPNYRAASELKFRGSNLESTVYSHTRENLYGNRSLTTIYNPSVTITCVGLLGHDCLIGRGFK